MATITPEQWQAQVLLEVGAGLDSSIPSVAKMLDVLTAQMPVLWEMNASRAYAPNLQYLYSKQQALDVLLGQYRMKVNKSLGPASAQLNQQFKNLLDLRKAVTDDIAKLEMQQAQSRPVVLSQIIAVAPIDPVANQRPLPPRYDSVDPNDPRYRGSPW